MQEEALKNNWSKMVIFTEPHAKEFFAEVLGKESSKPPRIFPWSEKVLKLRDLGVDYAFFLKFNSQLKSMTPESFMNHILLQLGIKKLVIGDDFRFGANREGDFELLKEWGKKSDIAVDKTETFLMEGTRVSSTRIREALFQSNFKEAKKLLGRPYTYTGKVVYGQRLGSQLGVPTANIWLPKNKLPLSGVYIVKATLEGREYGGVANMGTRPTVGGDHPVLEVHLLDFSKNIYSKRLTVEFCKKVRVEQKFDSLDALKEQIFKDISTAKAYFS
jgi:riboflavin kinase/FMN adenylyltransferase